MAFAAAGLESSEFGYFVERSCVILVEKRLHLFGIRAGELREDGPEHVVV